MEDYIYGRNKVEELLEELIEEVRNQGELNRINNTVLARRLMQSNGAPADEE